MNDPQEAAYVPFPAVISEGGSFLDDIPPMHSSSGGNWELFSFGLE